VTKLVYPDAKIDLVKDSKITRDWFRRMMDLINAAPQNQGGISVTITTAKLTGGGANGSMTFVNGVLTAQTAAT
jgi:hypothetical protein